MQDVMKGLNMREWFLCNRNLIIIESEIVPILLAQFLSLLFPTSHLLLKICDIFATCPCNQLHISIYYLRGGDMERQASGSDGGISTGSVIGENIVEVLLQPSVAQTSGGGSGASGGWRDDDDDEKDKKRNKTRRKGR